MIHSISFLLTAAFVVVAAAQGQCPDGWNFHEGACYYIGGAGYSFSDARTYCEDRDSQLVLISSADENTFIKSLLQDDAAAGAWFGLTLKSSFRGAEWKGLSPRSTVSFEDWANDEQASPIVDTSGSRRFGDIRCAALSKQYDWAWEAKDCGVSDGMKFVCKSCPLQQVCTSRTCFRLLCGEEIHEKADEICENLGGTLASIRSQEESDEVKAFMNQASLPKRTPGVWLAGSDEGTEDVWYWYTSDQGEEISTDVFRDWADNEPNNAGVGGRDENCMAMSSTDGWRWNDAMCFSPSAALCEISDENAITG
ncbi:macrophage mannose receptor 1-like [Plakobranchus ocellatus]|uniref:Macrophage mannose receptor 1-like n=1 Tax=Plakobranchus ocellatus TaxID=259542 RepID=A0AAV4DMS4_9GAST|nr:macrophage mannose receptor 1-like [Plakobranchus ocellatus]